jgi:para-nitrobenzyl esterase
MPGMTLRKLSSLCVVAFLGLQALLFVASPQATAGPDPTVVRVEGGWLRGQVTDDVVRFTGVPYAAPPTGDRRWTAPSTPEKWTGVRDATTTAPTCSQGGYDAEWNPVVIGDEDCLYVDVLRPRRPERHGPMPVLVWLHGGNLASGAGSEYDGARLAARGDLVVVTVNHRLGPLGFLSSPALDSGTSASGNLGLLDQAEALRWVRRNARAFGGDPHRVTLAGQSAGARSVCAHLASPGSRGLFHRAIVQSGACTTPVMTKAEADVKVAQAIATVGCAHAVDVAGCLRSLPAAHLIKQLADRGNPFLRERRDDPWGPVAGTHFLPRQPADALRTGHAANVPLLLGSMRDEAQGAVLGNLPDLTAEDYADTIGHVFGDDAGTVLAEYPADGYPTPALALSAVLTHWGYSCPTLTTAHAAGRHAPVYAYEMHEETPPADGVRYGAYHGWDLPFLWRTSIPVSQYPPLSTGQRRLSGLMMRYWASFAHAADPNGGHRPTWRPFAARHQALRLAVDGVHPIRPSAEGHCGFWTVR